MRSVGSLAGCVVCFLVGSGCGSPSESSPGGGDSGAASGSASGTTADSTDDADDGSDGAGTGGGGCVPGKVEPCTCPGGGEGAQACANDGKSFGPCDCGDMTGGGSGSSTGSGDTGSGTTGPTSTTDPGSGSSTPTGTTMSGGGTSTSATTGIGTTTGSATTGGNMSTTAGGPYGDCAIASDCAPGDVCASSDDGMHMFCSQPGCLTAFDCPNPPGGTAEKSCQFEFIQSFCVLDCSMNRTCPAGMECFQEGGIISPDEFCGWP